MKVLCEYSHLNGAEILRENFPKINKEINDVIEGVVGEKSKVSHEKNKKGKLLYSPKVFKSQFSKGFDEKGFSDISDNYFYPTCGNDKKIRGFKKLDFYKDDVGIQVQFGKYSFMIYDLSRFQYFYNKNKISVGVEILPSYMLQKQMSSGIGYGEQLISDIKLLKKQFPIIPMKIIVIDVNNSDDSQKKLYFID